MCIRDRIWWSFEEPVNALCSLQISSAALQKEAGGDKAGAQPGHKCLQISPGTSLQTQKMTPSQPTPQSKASFKELLRNKTCVCSGRTKAHVHCPYSCKDVFVHSHKSFLKVFSRATPWFFKSHGLGLSKIRGSYIFTHNLISFHKSVICNITIAHVVLSSNR